MAGKKRSNNSDKSLPYQGVGILFGKVKKGLRSVREDYAAHQAKAPERRHARIEALGDDITIAKRESELRRIRQTNRPVRSGNAGAFDNPFNMGAVDFITHGPKPVANKKSGVRKKRKAVNKRKKKR